MGCWWKDILTENLPLFGHRNWILVVDKAYPDQSAPGIMTISTGEKMGVVLENMVGILKKAQHVKPVFYMDKELDYITESMAPGVDAYRTECKRILAGANVQRLLHDQVFPKLDEASKLFKVLVFKTESQLAYSSVFIQLECGYWTSEQERTLREAMKK